jgi:hypothetical protein
MQVVLHKINVFTSQHLHLETGYAMKLNAVQFLLLFFLSGQTLSCAKETQLFMTTLNIFYVPIVHLTEAFLFFPPVFFITDMLITKLKFSCISYILCILQFC